MNVAYFLRPKYQVRFIYEDCTFRQGLEKMRHHGYAALPVLTREGKYVGTVTEGDFLWNLLDGQSLRHVPVRNLEALRVRDILEEGRYPSYPITVTMDELLDAAMDQNFIPIVDDADNFIGMVTRRDILRYFARTVTMGPLKKIV